MQRRQTPEGEEGRKGEEGSGGQEEEEEKEGLGEGGNVKPSLFSLLLSPSPFPFPAPHCARLTSSPSRCPFCCPFSPS